MFRDEAQKNRALRLLTQLSHKHGNVWTDAGPTSDAASVAKLLPRTDSVMLRAAWEMHSAPPDVAPVTLADLLACTEVGARNALLHLVTARDAGPAAIDAWCRRYRYSLRGERLMAMMRADYQRWVEHVAVVFEESRSLVDAAESMDVSLATAKRWHTDPAVRKAISPRAFSRSLE